MRSIHSIRKFVLAAALMLVPAASFAGVFISVNIAPPMLPVYSQPLCPGDGYIWTPGYWAYGPDGYYWVPGVWVQPPMVGYLWTPGYWGWSGSAYIFHAGYWGPHVGFYGGVNYGFGYTGRGYEGGYWNHGVFAYNRSVNNINVRNVHNVYNRTVVVNNYNRVSYNGGRGGINARANAQEEAAMREHRVLPTTNQISHRDAASRDRGQFASVNHGQPQTLTMRTVNDRPMNQQSRIANNTQNRQGNINPPVANNSRLTPQEHPQVNTRQNNVGRPVNNAGQNVARQHQQQIRPQAQHQPQSHAEGGHNEHQK